MCNPIDKLIQKTMEVAAQLGELSRSKIISIGSGSGEYERDMKKDVICVDPDPSVWERTDYMFAWCAAHKQPSLVGNCVMMSIWPDPSGSQNGYDVLAIKILKPKYVVVMTSGVVGTPTISGSAELMKFIESPKKNGYVLITDWMAEATYSDFDLMMHAFARCDVEVPVIERGYYEF